MDQCAVCHVKVSKNERILRKNGHFVMLGRNVTAKLNRNTRSKCHRIWDKILQWDSLSHSEKPFKFIRSECHNLGWTDNLSTMRLNVTVVNCHSRRFVGWMLRLVWNVMWPVCGWTDRQGTGKQIQALLPRICPSAWRWPKDVKKLYYGFKLNGLCSSTAGARTKVEKKIQRDILKYLPINTTFNPR